MNPSRIFGKCRYVKFALPQDVGSDPQEFFKKLNELASKFPFKRCSPSRSSSIGFIHPSGESIEEYGGSSYNFEKTAIFSIYLQEKKISSSELSYDLHIAIKEFSDKNGREADKNEISNIKEKLLEEKLASAPSSFTNIFLSLDIFGNCLINTTTKKHFERVISFMRNSMNDVILEPYINIYAGTTRVLTNFVASRNATMPDGVNLSFGDRGEGKRDQQKFTFKKINADDEDVLSMVKSHFLEITGMEVFFYSKKSETSFYLKDNGISKIEWSGGFKDRLAEIISEESENSLDDVNAIAFRECVNLIIDFHYEYLIMVNKGFGIDCFDPEIINKTIQSKKQFENITS